MWQRRGGGDGRGLVPCAAARAARRARARGAALPRGPKPHRAQRAQPARGPAAPPCGPGPLRRTLTAYVPPGQTSRTGAPPAAAMTVNLVDLGGPGRGAGRRVGGGTLAARGWRRAPAPRPAPPPPRPAPPRPQPTCQAPAGRAAPLQGGAAGGRGGAPRHAFTPRGRSERTPPRPPPPPHPPTHRGPAGAPRTRAPTLAIPKPRWWGRRPLRAQRRAGAESRHRSRWVSRRTAPLWAVCGGRSAIETPCGLRAPHIARAPVILPATATPRPPPRAARSPAFRRRRVVCPPHRSSPRAPYPRHSTHLAPRAACPGPLGMVPPASASL
jgi:hypothetical protein